MLQVFCFYGFQVLVVCPNVDINLGDIDKIFDSNKCNILLITDMKWFLQEFLGIIFSPECFLTYPSICHNGYISQKDLDQASREYNVRSEVLISILDFFRVSTEIFKALSALEEAKNFHIINISCLFFYVWYVSQSLWRPVLVKIAYLLFISIHFWNYFYPWFELNLYYLLYHFIPHSYSSQLELILSHTAGIKFIYTLK